MIVGDLENFDVRDIHGYVRSRIRHWRTRHGQSSDCFTVNLDPYTPSRLIEEMLEDEHGTGMNTCNEAEENRRLDLQDAMESMQ